MTLVYAIRVLFGKTAPMGADLEEAFNALRGMKNDDLPNADKNALDRLADSFEDFTCDPSGWLKKASATDPRHSWWTKLAQALGASVTSGSAPMTPSSSPRPAASVAPADPPTPDIEPEQGIDPDALAGGAPPPSRREGSGGKDKGGGGVSISSTGGDGDGEEGNEDPRPKERKDRRGEAPRPLVPFLSGPDLAVREVPPQGLAVIRSARYQQMYVRIVECIEVIRSGGTADLWALRVEVNGMSRSKDGQTEREGIHLEGLIRALQQGVDLRRPHYFKAVYETGGTYDD